MSINANVMQIRRKNRQAVQYTNAWLS